MNWAYTMTNSPAMEALGWTLIHSLWQGATVFLILKLLLRWVTAGAASLRYVLVISALAVMCCWSVSTFLQVYSPIPSETFEFGPGISEIIVLPEEAFVEPQFPIPFSEETETSSLWLESMLQPMRPYVPVLVWIWFAGLCFLSIRFTGNLYYLHQLKRKGAYRVCKIWEDRLAAFLMRTGIKRPVKLLESRRVTGPFTIGFLKPVILLPMGLLTGMDPFQIEAIIMHELAHIRRADYLINLLQSLVEVLFFYHPAVQWMSRQARIEREHCCDDLVMEWRQDPMVYAQALMNLQSSRIHPQSTFAMSITGNKPSFTQRIQRLFEPRTARVRDKAIMLLMVLSMSFALMAFNLPTTIESEPYFVEELVYPEISPITTIEILPEFSQYDLDKLADELISQGIHLQFDLLEFKRGKLSKVSGSLDTEFGHAQFSSNELEAILLIVDWEKKSLGVIVRPEGPDARYRFGEDKEPELVDFVELEEPFEDEGEVFEGGNDTWEEGDEGDFDAQFEGFGEGGAEGEVEIVEGALAEAIVLGDFFSENSSNDWVFPDVEGQDAPVLIIDGKRFDDMDWATYKDRLFQLNPNDIDNIVVLKKGAEYEALNIKDNNAVILIDSKSVQTFPQEARLGGINVDGIKQLQTINVHPGDSPNSFKFHFQLKTGTSLRVLMLDAEKKVISTLADQYFRQGPHILKLSSNDLPNGKYYLDFQQSYQEGYREE